ncbi:MAG: MBL fold metallo-hydrolase [Coxiellaceae bacterium]|nr:MBL fold metallo-hydrolase [Coxiellaceae bacterium]
MSTTVTEIAEDIYRISTYISEFNLQFNQFLIIDEEPMLYHTGMKGIFDIVKESVATKIDPSEIKWISFSHTEADECGSLYEWQQLAPHSTALCSEVGKYINVDDFVALRPAKGMADNEVMTTGKRRFRYIRTPHVPHGWDAGLFFEETTKTLLCSDLFHQNGNVEAKTTSDVIGRYEKMLTDYQQGPFAYYQPYSSHTNAVLKKLAALKPSVLATMHGSTFEGDGEQAIADLAVALKKVMGENLGS